MLDVLGIFENSNNYHLPGGIALVVNEMAELVGTVSEGDIRRAMLAGKSLQSQAK